MNKVIGIGWDVGGWMGRKHGIAVAQWNVGSEKIQWLGSTVCSIPNDTMFSPQFLVGCVVEDFDVTLLKDSKIVIGIDAPLGYPKDFIKLVTGQQMLFERPAREIDNGFAYRETERYIYETFRKKPLSATFDKLGNNATVALYHIQAWCRELGFSAHPMMQKENDTKIAIEVYPALIKDVNGQALSPVKGLLPDDVEEGTDQGDAAICAVMAIAYGLNGRCSKLPRLVGPYDKWVLPSRTEGWIYHFPK